MALSVSSVNGQNVVNGITRDPRVTSPLGRVYFQVGPHLLGFDDNFAEPVIVPAYYDPSQDPLLARSMSAVEYVGYLQFMRLSFRGMPIPPEVYGGKLADRTPYVFGRDKQFVDFMGPADASQHDIATPFYPYNALLTRDIGNSPDFFEHPLSNGSLWSPENLGTTQSLAASLFGQIAPGLVTPKALESLLTNDRMILELSLTPQELAGQEAYRFVLDSLETTALVSAPDDGPPLGGIDESQIEAQVIGDYVLLTLPDDEDLGETLVIGTTEGPGGGTDVVVHLLTDYDMAGLSADAARDALWRIREYQIAEGVQDSADLRAGTATGRGQSGLHTPPFTFTPGDFVLELRYWTVATAIKTVSHRPTPHLLSAITWAALLQFDEDTGQMNLASIRRPRPGRYDLPAGIGAFKKATRSRNTATAHIDASNFTKAAMRRAQFAGGGQLSFVDGSGAPVT